MDPLKQIVNSIKATVEEQYKDTAYTESYVAFLDILGMKNLINEEYKTLRKVFNVVEQAVTLYGNMSIAGGEKFISDNQIKITIMSDSIVISINSDTDHAFSKLIGFSSYIIKQFLDAIDYPIYLRGAITKGDIFQKGTTVFGPALTEAYLLETELASSMRCIIAEKIISDPNVSDYIEKYSHVLVRDSCDGLYLIDYITDENKKSILNHTKEVLSTSTNNKLRSKYLWLENYINNKTNA